MLEAVDEEPPDVALLDIRMPPTHTDEGVRAALEIRARHPSVGVLVLSQYVELGLAMKLFEESMEASATC
jgi:DNA-binding NarL/FixJ family response regulator